MVFVETLHRHFPKRIEVPELLIEFAQWLNNAPRGAVGVFESLSSRPLKSEFRLYARASAAAEQLGLFMSLCDGGWLALWAYDTDDAPAVVLIGRKGELRLVAPSYERFLLDLSKAKTGVADLDAATASHRPQLAAWLRKKKVTAPRAAPPDFTQWFHDASAPKKRRAAENMVEHAVPLLGKPVSTSAFRAFATALGHWPLPSSRTGDTHYLSDVRGFDLCIERRPKPTFASLRFNGESNADQRAFAGSLPLGISWADRRFVLVRRLGSPNKSFVRGVMHFDQWKHQRRTVTVSYARPKGKGRVSHVSLSEK